MAAQLDVDANGGAMKVSGLRFITRKEEGGAATVAIRGRSRRGKGGGFKGKKKEREGKTKCEGRDREARGGKVFIFYYF